MLSVSEEDDDFDEEPTVVVLQPGDLTAEEAEKEKQRQETGNLAFLLFIFVY